MPFYRCSMPSSSGGGGGGSADDYVKITHTNGDTMYPKINTGSLYKAGITSGTFKDIHIGNSIYSCYLMFDKVIFTCEESVIIPDSVVDTSYMFNSTRYFNAPVTIGNNVTNVSAMFYGANGFNQPVHLPDSVTFAPMMFYASNSFNSKVTFGNRIYNIAQMFAVTSVFNKPFIIPTTNYTGNNITAASILQSANNFNSPILIEEPNIAISYGLRHDKNFGSNIIFNASTLAIAQTNVRALFNNTNASIRKNIYAYNLTPFMGTTTSNSLTNLAMTWTATTNGYYNASHNIYLLNNVSDALNDFWNVYNQV